MNLSGWKIFLASGLLLVLETTSAHAGLSRCNGAPNGILDGDEQCETGACCTATCELQSAVAICRASTDADPPEACGEQGPAVEASCPVFVLNEGGNKYCDNVGCDDGNSCTDDFCNEAEQTCEYVDNSLPCDDGDFCSVGDRCVSGFCDFHDERDCSDGNVCTTDSCNEATDTCDHIDNTNPCDDGLFCTTGDTCSNGACVAGPARDCNDTNACTSDSCNEATQACDNTNNTVACDDADPCTTNDVCAGGICKGDLDAGCQATTTTSEPEPVCGDANGDGRIKAGDALFALQAAVATRQCPLELCDYSGNGKIQAGDALAILRAAVGLPTTPKCPPPAAALAPSTTL